MAFIARSCSAARLSDEDSSDERLAVPNRLFSRAIASKFLPRARRLRAPLRAAGKATLRFLSPPVPVVVIGMPVAAVLLAFAFAREADETPLTYALYVGSAYLLASLCVLIARADLPRRASAFARRFRLAERLLDDLDFRRLVGTGLGALVNVAWAVANLAGGVMGESAWFVTLGVYYLLLALMRALLTRRAQRANRGADPLERVHRTCRSCGILLGLAAWSFAGTAVLVHHRLGGFAYPDSTIYAVALFAFYSLIVSVVNFVKLRAHDNPAYTAITTVNLATALVSLFALEVAMLSTFGGSEDESFAPLMISATGAVVCAALVGLSVWLIARSIRSLRALR